MSAVGPKGSLSFDQPADLYDATRQCDVAMLDKAIDRLAATFPPDRYRNLFEPGIGTGRIAIPLARRGYSVTGVDISLSMLALLKAKLATEPRRVHIDYQLADVTALPMTDGVFDMAVVVHLLYFIPDWKRALSEISRVSRDGAPIVLLHTGTGAEVPFINDRYKAICGQNGHDTSNRGLTSTKEAFAHLQSLGFTLRTLDGSWRWDTRISLSNALSYLSDRAYSFTLTTPPIIHRTAVETIRAELKAEWGTLATEACVPNEIKIVIAERAE